MTAVQYPFLDLGAVNRPFMDGIAQAMERVCRSGRYIGGEEVGSFENNLKRLTGTSYAVGVSNGLDALRLTLRAAVILKRLAPGDEVIVPANTFIASVLAIADAGLMPVLADIDENTLNLDTSRLEKYLTPRTRAIMPVHLYGRICWDRQLKDFAVSNRLFVIEDNAQAIGAVSSLKGFGNTFASGSLGHAGAFSFYPTKNLGAMGDAGAVTTNDKALADTVRALANYGTDRRYHNIHAGFNCRIDPVQAAVLNVKFPYLEAENSHRRNIAATYRSHITNPLVRLPLEGGLDNVWHQFVVRVSDRDRFRRYLEDNGVGTDIHYAVPPHRQPCFASLHHAPLPVTELVADEIVSLPVSSGTSIDDAAAISRIINSFS